MISIIIQILLISVSVAMDAFAVSIGKGLTVSRVRVQDAVKSVLWLGGFQMLFPILGYFAASTFSKYVTQFDHWIIFALLVFIGGNMVHEAFEEDEENSKETAQFDWKHMLPLAVATSIDALAVGVTFAFLRVDILPAVCFIGAVTFVFSFAGVKMGSVFGARYQSKAELFGGGVLIGMGIKILLEHLGVLG